MRGAPRPDRSEGFRAAPKKPLEHKLLWIPRAILFVPRWAAEIAFAPMRGAIYLWERFQLGQQLTDIFFNDARTFGAYPTVEVQTGFGVNLGARVVYRNIFGANESLSASAGFGGRYSQTYSGRFDSGTRLSRVRFTLVGGYLVGQNERFYGYGNGDEIAASRADPGRDALLRGPAVASRYRYDRGYTTLTSRLRLAGTVTLTLGAEMTRQTFFDDNSQYGREAIELAYQPQSLVGFQRDLVNVTGALELRWDGRRRRDRYVPRVMYSSGHLLLASLGYTRGFNADPSDYLRYVAEARYYFDLFQGTRVLEVRLRLEGVTAELDRLPFVAAPTLGGGDLLRGYLPGRFRDRVSLIGTLQYSWVLTYNTVAYLFVDSGRVYREIDALSLEKLRVGFGGGLTIHFGVSGVRLGLQIAGTPDGDVRFDLRF